MKNNPFAHWGLGTDISSFDDARRRENALADGLRKLAAANGIQFREPLSIDGNGEFHLAVSNETAQDSKHDPCGGFGEVIARLLNDSGGARTGIQPTRYMSPENGWCRLNHFAAQSILEKVNGIEK